MLRNGKNPSVELNSVFSALRQTPCPSATEAIADVVDKAGFVLQTHLSLAGDVVFASTWSALDGVVRYTKH